jgi:hypothetical protein
MNTPMNPTDPLTIVLQAQEWNVVMAALHDAAMPYRLTSPVIGKLTQQFQERNTLPGVGVARPRAAGNGEDPFPANLSNRPLRDIG